MHLSKLVDECGGVLVGSDLEITDLHYDSRLVGPQSLFFAVSGSSYDGHEFAESAVRAGAAAVVVERSMPELRVPQWIVDNTRQAMAPAAHHFFGRPSEQLNVVAVTGTNGKTTTTFLIKQMLEALGMNVGLMGTIQNMIADQVFPASRTTPEAIDLQRFMAESVELGADYFVFEASSHGAALGRLDFTAMDCVVFTNLTQDHLDFHGDMETYFQAKANLFRENAKQFGSQRRAVINVDDLWGQKLLGIPDCVPSLTFGTASADIKAENIVLLPHGVTYDIIWRHQKYPVSLPLAGKFNVLNSLAALTALMQLGFSVSDSLETLKELRPVPGRFELVDAGQDFMVIVDYAHTPDGLVNVLSTARSVARGRVITVFGAGGDRDRTKRPLMARAAAEFSDFIFVTSDNPRSEDPLTICTDVAQGLVDAGFSSYEVQPDRRTAIQAAVSMAAEGDSVVIAGKGHETYQESHGQRIHFDDRQEAWRLIKELS